MEAGPKNKSKLLNFDPNKKTCSTCTHKLKFKGNIYIYIGPMIVLMCFEDPFCTKCNFREFVLTHVILVPGARGRGGPSSGPWRDFGGFRGLGGIREIVPNRANYT